MILLNSFTARVNSAPHSSRIASQSHQTPTELLLAISSVGSSNPKSGLPNPSHSKSPNKDGKASAASAAKPSASAKHQKGCQAGVQGYKADEIRTLCEVVEEILPLGQDEWEVSGSDDKMLGVDLAFK